MSCLTSPAGRSARAAHHRRPVPLTCRNGVARSAGLAPFRVRLTRRHHGSQQQAADSLTGHRTRRRPDARGGCGYLAWRCRRTSRSAVRFGPNVAVRGPGDGFRRTRSARKARFRGPAQEAARQGVWRVAGVTLCHRCGKDKRRISRQRRHRCGELLQFHGSHAARARATLGPAIDYCK